ncbi:MAG: RidA family protein [Pseudomonadota bacterium]
MASRDVVFPEGRQDIYNQFGYSPAIRSGGFLFVSGQVGSREDGSPEPDLATQAELAFENLDAVLRAGGCTFEDIVDFTVYTTDPENIVPHFMSAREKWWGEPPYPTLTGVGVTWLSGFSLELKVIAKLPEGAQ